MFLTHEKELRNPAFCNESIPSRPGECLAIEVERLPILGRGRGYLLRFRQILCCVSDGGSGDKQHGKQEYNSSLDHGWRLGWISPQNNRWARLE